MIRTLRADEIECRVQMIKDDGSGCSLILYKDARADMRILDETFGITGWEREHQMIGNNLYCTVRIWDPEKNQWISKQDVGTESYTEAEKGQASDSFKRACFNLGIGRELYTAPFIWINLNPGETYNNKGRMALSSRTKFKVHHIAYNDNKEIVELEIKDQNGVTRFQMGKPQPAPKTQPQQQPKQQPKSRPTTNQTNQCIDCSKKLTQGEETFSTKNYGKPLCFNCQKNHQRIG